MLSTALSWRCPALDEFCIRYCQRLALCLDDVSLGINYYVEWTGNGTSFVLDDAINID